MSKNVILSLLVCLLAACAPALGPELGEGAGDGDVTQTPEPVPTGDWSIRLIQTGGFAGVYRWVIVDGDGLVSAGDERTDQSGSTQVSAEELTELRALAGQAASSDPGRPNSACADCFEYEVVISIDEEDRHVYLDDTTLPGSGFEELVSELQDLMRRALGEG